MEVYKSQKFCKFAETNFKGSPAKIFTALRHDCGRLKAGERTGVD